MHEASEARTVSVKKFEEVKPVKQDKEHSDVLFSSSVQAKRHSYFGQSLNAVSKSTHVGIAEQVQIHSQVDVDAVHDANVARNEAGGELSEKLKKSTMEGCGAVGGGVDKEINRSDTKITVQCDDNVIFVSSDSDENLQKKESKYEKKSLTD